MSYSIDKAVFERYAKEISDLANICFDTPGYTLYHVEVCCVLADYNDGLGNRVISRALVRNPSKNIYDLVEDALGPPEDALKLMLNNLKQKAEKDFPNKYKAKLLKSN